MLSKQAKILFFLNWKRDPDGDYQSKLFVFKFTDKLSHSLPEKKYNVWWYYEKGKLRPFRLEQFKGNMSTYMQAEKLISLLSSAKLIAVPSTELPPEIGNFLEFLNFAKATKPKKVSICMLCYQENRKITTLTSKTQYDYYSKSVCKLCAQKEVNGDYQKKGYKNTTELRQFSKIQLEKTRSIEKAVAVINDNLSTSKSGTNTLFDVIPADNEMKGVPLRKFLKDRKQLEIFGETIIQLWKKFKITQFLPVQQLAIKSGLFEFRDQLIVAGTSSGKTFVGELAGLNAMKNRKTKFVFLTPLVALTNQKYTYFKRLYGTIGYRVGIRVGVTKLNLDEQINLENPRNFKNSDIIVGTYEAFDWILRSGTATNIGEIGVVVVDEVQLIGDQERGQQLDGMLVRIRTLFPRCQIICLSATIGNLHEVADLFKLTLIHYERRPIPLERHLVLAETVKEKEQKLVEIIQKEIEQENTAFKKSLVFTNTRKRCQVLASLFRVAGFKATYYHAGLTYWERKKIETQFEKGNYDVITTTAALGAGVNFPVSQVIIETPSMGARWLKVSEFYQMIGRAGRFGFHKLGKAYLLSMKNYKIHTQMEKSEDQIGFWLLTAQIEDLDLNIEFDSEADQLLAKISAQSPCNHESLEEYYNALYYTTNKFSDMQKILTKAKMAVTKENKWFITALGRACATSFISPIAGYKIATQLLTTTVENLSISMNSFENIYLSNKAHAEVESITKAKMSSRFLNDGVVETIFSGQFRGKWKFQFANMIKKWLKSIFDCSCKESPYCNHPAQKISKIILNYRRKGASPVEISTQLTSEYELFAYPGDLYTWLESFVYSLEAIKRLSSALGKDKTHSESSKLIRHIVKPRLYQQKTKISRKQYKPGK